jgi:hypothetical protein
MHRGRFDNFNPASAGLFLVCRGGRAGAAAKAIGDEGYRAHAMGSLAPHLSPEQIAEALAACPCSLCLHQTFAVGDATAWLV